MKVINNTVIETADTEERLKQQLQERRLPLFLPVIRKVEVDLPHGMPIANLIRRDESTVLEFKSTLQWDVKENRKSKDLEFAVLKTIAAFLNSEGGTLLIGVQNNGSIYGLENDLALWL